MVLPNADTHAGQRGGSRPSPRLSEFPVVETAITADWDGQQGPKAERKTQGHMQKNTFGIYKQFGWAGKRCMAGGGWGVWRWRDPTLLPWVLPTA